MSVLEWTLLGAGIWLYLCGMAVTGVCQHQAGTYTRWQLALGVVLWPAWVTAHCGVVAWALGLEIGATLQRRWRA